MDNGTTMFGTFIRHFGPEPIVNMMANKNTVRVIVPCICDARTFELL